jgi:hypothetical protein
MANLSQQEQLHSTDNDVRIREAELLHAAAMAYALEQVRMYTFGQGRTFVDPEVIRFAGYDPEALRAQFAASQSGGGGGGYSSSPLMDESFATALKNTGMGGAAKDGPYVFAGLVAAPVVVTVGLELAVASLPAVLEKGVFFGGSRVLQVHAHSLSMKVLARAGLNRAAQGALRNNYILHANLGKTLHIILWLPRLPWEL